MGVGVLERVGVLGRGGLEYLGEGGWSTWERKLEYLGEGVGVLQSGVWSTWEGRLEYLRGGVGTPEGMVECQ